MNHLWRSDYNFLVNWMIRDNDSQYAANESHSAPFLCVASLQSATRAPYRHPVTFPHSFINSRHYGRWNERRIFEGSPIKRSPTNYQQLTNYLIKSNKREIFVHLDSKESIRVRNDIVSRSTRSHLLVNVAIK